MAVILVSVSISAVVITSFVLLHGPDRLPRQLVRFGLTCLLGRFLYRKANWARWLGGIFYVLAGWASLSGIVGRVELSSRFSSHGPSVRILRCGPPCVA